MLPQINPLPYKDLCFVKIWQVEVNYNFYFKQIIEIKPKLLTLGYLSILFDLLQALIEDQVYVQL